MCGALAEPGHVNEEVGNARGPAGGRSEAEAAAAQAREGGLGHGGREGTGDDRVGRGSAETEHLGCGVTRGRGTCGDRPAAGWSRGGHRNLAGHAPHAIPRP